MAVLKVLEILSDSKKSWEDAAQNAVKEVSKTVRNIRSVNIKNFSAEVKNGVITEWRVNCNVTFEKENK